MSERPKNRVKIVAVVLCVSANFLLDWLSPSSSTAFPLYSKEEDESSTGSKREVGLVGLVGGGGTKSDVWGFI